jgi:hypothetical protein
LYIALTKKLIEKVKKEWSDTVAKREEELEQDKRQMLLQVSSHFKNVKLVMSSEGREDEDSFLERNNIEVIIHE